ncbi:hypothetical protein QBA38_43315 [Streptomyces stelliscabiei]|uniref:hypothetical protein n=1 Tax=Streptomyces stelliscabiei TaxID=146820 RepID=UPI002FEFD803
MGTEVPVSSRNALVVPEHAHIKLPGDADIAVGGAHGVQYAGEEDVARTSGVQLLDHVVGVVDRPLLLEQERLELAPVLIAGPLPAAMPVAKVMYSCSTHGLVRRAARSVSGAVTPCDLFGEAAVGGRAPRHVPEPDDT